MQEIITLYLDTPLTPLWIAAGADGTLHHCSFRPLYDLPAPSSSPPPAVDRIADQLLEYVFIGRTHFTIPCSLKGTAFQLSVWHQTQLIPYGETRTYRELAAQTGNPKAWRAVGSALKHNPLLIVVPCHRVIPASGGVGGFAGGSKLKKTLLEHELQGLSQMP